MTLRDCIRQHLDRLNLTEAWLNDPQSRWSLTLLSQWMDTTEAAMVDAGIDESRRRQVLDRVLYGSMPSRAELELRERMMATLVDQRQRGLGGGGAPGGGTAVAAAANAAGGSGKMVFDPESQTWLGGGVPGGGSTVVTGRGYSESEPPSHDHGTIIMTDGRG